MLGDFRGFVLRFGEIIQHLKRVEGKHGRVDGDSRQLEKKRSVSVFGSGCGGWTWFNAVRL